MTNYILRKNATYLITYINLIDRAHDLIFAQTKELARHKPGDFGNLRDHYTKRIRINKSIVTYLNNRITNIKKSIS
jgi:hypothetical protein